jgi:general secretion pathway protein D
MIKPPFPRAFIMCIRNCISALLILGITLSPAASVTAAENMTLNFKEADIESVIKSVAMITGKTFVVDPQVKGKVTIVSSEALPAAEVYAIFLSILQVHDFAAVEAGNVVKIVPVAKAKQDLVILDDRNHVLPEDRIVTRVHKLQHLQADKLVPVLRPLLNTRAGQMTAVAVKEGNSLIITDQAGQVERLLRIIKRLDQDTAGKIEVVRLEHANAQEMVTVLVGLMVGTGNVAPEQLRMAADSRSNSILLAGDQHHLLRAKSLIFHLDTPLKREGDTQVIFLRYAKAKDLVPILGGIDLPEAPATGAAGVPGAARRAAAGQQRADVSIQADEGTNALIITGPPAAVQALQSVVRQLDIRRVQLMIEAVIVEVTARKGAELGVQWFAADHVVAGTNFPGGKVGINQLLAGGEQGLAQLGAASGFNLGFIGGGTTKILGKEIFNLGALVNALATDSDTNILSTPSLVTMDNQEAEIVVGQNVPFITGSFSNTGTGSAAVNPFQTIERQDVGLKLKVKPQINEGNVIRLDIRQEVSTIEAFRPEGPVTNTRNISTSVMVEDGRVLVLGGLISDDVQESISKVPVLGSIPLLGALFRHTTTSREKRNLMVFLRPVILRDQDVSRQLTFDKYDQIRSEQLNRDKRGIPLLHGQRHPLLREFEEYDQAERETPGNEMPAGEIPANEIPASPMPVSEIPGSEVSGSEAGIEATGSEAGIEATESEVTESVTPEREAAEEYRRAGEGNID